MTSLNLHAGWLAILAGLLMGVVLGAWFHHEDFLGGYGSWRRRLVRLAHISLVGLGLLNLAFVFSVSELRLPEPPRVASVLLVVGAVTMPLVCLLSAWRMEARRLFFIPVLSLVLGVGDFVWKALG